MFIRDGLNTQKDLLSMDDNVQHISAKTKMQLSFKFNNYNTPSFYH